MRKRSSVDRLRIMNQSSRDMHPMQTNCTHAKPSVMPSTGNPDEYSGDMNLDKEQLFQYFRDVDAVGVKVSADSIMTTTSSYPDSQVTSTGIASTKTIVLYCLSFALHKRLTSGVSRMRYSFSRSEKKCTATVKLHPDGYATLVSKHVPGCFCKNEYKVEKVLAIGDECSDRMYAWVEEQCLDELHVHKSKAKIWNECH